MNKPVDLDIAPFRFDNTFAAEMEGFYAPWLPEPKAAPRLLKFNRVLAEELGLDADALNSPEGAAIFAGNAIPLGASPIAQAYAGHQFGQFVPQLGDGRAVLLGEVIDKKGIRRDIQLKGSGRTPFSRGGDGKAAIGPMLREYLIGEAMHALGIPTTRALAVAATGEEVRRETLLPGAVLTRVAQSHIRVGTFEYFAARKDVLNVKRLADYTVARHYPELTGAPYIEFLKSAIARQVELVARWAGAGFIHGVMNTDNMALSGETIDYGPCAFIEHYDPDTVFSSIDRHGRYAFGNQSAIAQWNLACLAETLLPLLDGNEETAVQLAMEAVDSFAVLYDEAWLNVLRGKLGFARAEAQDAELAREFLEILRVGKIDYTQAFRALASAAEFDPSELRRPFGRATGKLDVWLPKWQERLAHEDRTPAQIARDLRRVNPYVIPRNYLVEEALEAASREGDMTPFDALLEALLDPYAESAAVRRYAIPAAREHTENYRTFCGT
jgi:serine/tyrosine/threonine adenylyltransferase